MSGCCAQTFRKRRKLLFHLFRPCFSPRLLSGVICRYEREEPKVSSLLRRFSLFPDFCLFHFQYRARSSPSVFRPLCFVSPQPIIPEGEQLSTETQSACRFSSASSKGRKRKGAERVKEILSSSGRRPASITSQTSPIASRAV